MQFRALKILHLMPKKTAAEVDRFMTKLENSAESLCTVTLSYIPMNIYRFINTKRLKTSSCMDDHLLIIAQHLVHLESLGISLHHVQQSMVFKPL